MMWYGKGWLAYYNNISYSVDRFSSYYSGRAIYTFFREKQTLYYQSPSLGHFNFSYSNIANNGKGNSHRIQYVISAHIDQWNINIGIDDLNRGTDQKIIGAAISYNSTNWYVGGKIERFKSKLFRGSHDNYGVNNSTADNLFAQYSINKKNSIKLMLANVEGTYGDNIFHFGYDYSYSDKLKVFIEYYSEQTTAAISERRLSSFLGTSDFNQPADSGGDAIVLGFRYDFSLNNKK